MYLVNEKSYIANVKKKLLDNQQLLNVCRFFIKHVRHFVQLRLYLQTLTISTWLFQFMLRYLPNKLLCHFRHKTLTIVTTILCSEPPLSFF